MSRVVPYWTDWMERWPDARALAEAPKAEVITAWGRLGYPRRALRLQECARVVAEEYGDELPRTYDELVALPGIGDYTASAVLSFAFGERIAVIDTNIRRVLSRVFLGTESHGGAASPAERCARQPHVAPRQGSWGRCRLHGPCIPIRRTHFPAAQRTSIGYVESVGDGIGRGGLHSQDAVMRDLPDCG